MVEDDNICGDHSGCLARITNLETATISQWEAMGKQTDRVDEIMTRLNVVLGGIVVSVVLLLINLLVKIGTN